MTTINMYVKWVKPCCLIDWLHLLLLPPTSGKNISGRAIPFLLSSAISLGSEQNEPMKRGVHAPDNTLTRQPFNEKGQNRFKSVLSLQPRLKSGQAAGFTWYLVYHKFFTAIGLFSVYLQNIGAGG